MGRKSAHYINRELSWLEFNQRVLDEARDPRTPPLERLKFLGITGSNLDEFFMVRVGGLQMLARGGVTKKEPSGLTPAGQLEEIARRTQRMSAEQYECLHSEIEPALESAGIVRHGIERLTERQERAIERRFENEAIAVLTPMAVTAENFPTLENLALHLLVRLEKDDEGDDYAVVPLGRAPSRFLTLPAEGGYQYVLLEDAVRHFVARFFPGRTVLDCAPFRITRNADLVVREERAFDLLQAMQGILDARKESHCVRLEVGAESSSTARRFLIRAVEAEDAHVHVVSGPPDLSAFLQIAGLSGFDDLKNKPWTPQPSPRVDPKTPMFDVVADGDVLLHHPFDSFEPVVRFLEEAAEDPDVLAIKQVLYRTAKDSRIIAALKRAAELGKYVTAVVELRARFDEARNIDWARGLEKAGVQVIYGVQGFKIHAKVCVVSRREADGIRRYVHYATGNYNESTARLYTDVGLLTCDEDLAADATTFFHAVSGYSQLHRFRKIDIAPVGLREKLLRMVRAEEELARQGQEARIVVKTNSLVDPELIEALYAASSAGVDVQLIIRGICCLRPGVKGLSENIRVVSIVDRLLEHSRIFHFRHDGDDLVYIASADWMPRNLDRRLETLVPIEDPSARDRLLDVLECCLQDDVKGRRLMSDGSYVRNEVAEGAGARSQQALYKGAKRAVKAAREAHITSLEPHRAPDLGA